MKAKASRRIRFFAAAVVLGGLAGVLLLGEAVMRGVRPDLVPSHQLSNIPDPLIGWRFRPYQEMDGKTEHGERRRARTNALGFADADHDLEAAAHVTRIAFLGDSFTAATHVDIQDSFVAVARDRLNLRDPSRSFEALNFGQSGFGAANEYLCWKYYASPFRPNAVILAFFLGNDVGNNLANYPTESYRSPKFEWVEGKLKAIPFQMGAGAGSHERQKRNWFYRTFLAPSLLYQQYKLFERDARFKFRSARSRRMGSEDAKKPFWERSYAPIDWQVYLRDPGPEFERAWRVTEALLVNLAAEVRATGASFHVLLLPGVESVDPREFQASFPRYPGIEQFSFDLDGPRRRMTAFLSREKIPAIDLTPVFQAELKNASPWDLYFKFDQHFSVRGHRLAGEAIAREFP